MKDAALPARAAVLGAGSWGTALAMLLARNGIKVRLWCREPEVLAQIRQTGENQVFLPGVPLPEELEAVASVEEALPGAELVFLVVPSQYLRGFLERHRNALPAVPIVCCAKGIEQGTLCTPDEVMLEELPGKFHQLICLLSGPSFAREVALDMPTNVTVASTNADTAELVQRAVSTGRFRAYTGTDLTGVALGGAVKNVIAIAAGGSDGFGLGNNARAGLITRGLAEMSRLAVRKGANPLTLAGLSGMGDLVLTCTGDLSRNRQVGFRLAKGETLAHILESMRMVAEGVDTALSVHQLATRLGVDLPICEAVYRCLHLGESVAVAMQSLLDRPVGAELR
jgi:glycerol-3-phosphate dehydrogenase (NAD(P)+)